METMERSKRRDRRSYTPEFKSEIVGRCRAGDRSIAEVARDFDLTESAVRRWVAQAEIDAGERPGLTSDNPRENLSPASSRRHLTRPARVRGKALPVGETVGVRSHSRQPEGHFRGER